MKCAVQQEANMMVEEFMVVVNKSVATVLSTECAYATEL